MARELLLEIIEAFPQADPASDFYHEEINGCEAVDFLSRFIPRIRDYLDAPPPTVAVWSLDICRVKHAHRARYFW